MKPYHCAWLSKHPERDADWLQSKLHEGFDVHHLDGDHQNNSPDNLVLIEHQDHMNLHGFSMRRALAPDRDPSAPEGLAIKKTSARYEQGRLAYNMKRIGLTWGQVGEAIGLGPRNICGADATAMAREYAKVEGLVWPKPRSALPGGYSGLKRVDGQYVKAYGPHPPKVREWLGDVEPSPWAKER